MMTSSLIFSLADKVLPKHNTNPMIKVHKLENIQICIKFLKQQGVQIAGIHADGMNSSTSWCVGCYILC